jgi:ABC-type nickel/cobalt efflux system permease component RcnA
MSKTQTTHEPSPDELEHASADGGLHHPGDLADEVHGPDDHGETDGHDDHAHAEEALGPVDVQAWGALILGIAAGLLVVVCLVITTRLLVAAPA